MTVCKQYALKVTCVRQMIVRGYLPSEGSWVVSWGVVTRTACSCLCMGASCQLQWVVPHPVHIM